MTRPSSLLFVAASSSLLALLVAACGDSTSVVTQPDAGATGGSGGDGTGGSPELPNDEICDNAFDDDGDGKIDCADTDCKAYSCTAPPPADWNGPFSLVPPAAAPMGDAGAEPACQPGWSEVGLGLLGPLAGDPATCAACACGDIAVGCSLPDVKSHADNACGTPANATVKPLASGTCSPFNSADVQALAATAPTLTALSCPASGGEPTVTPSTNGGSTVLCESTAGGGCDKDEICAPQPGAGNPMCIARSGAQECPGAPYTVKHEIFSGVTDSRGCTKCTCAPTPVTCAGSTTVYPNSTDCTGQSVAVPNDNSCVPSSSGPVTGSILYTETPASGSCTAGGGKPTGGITGVGLVTVCCTP